MIPANQPFYGRFLPACITAFIDWITGRSFLEKKLAPLINDAMGDSKTTLAPLRQRLLSNTNNEHVRIPRKNGAFLDGVLMKADRPAKGVILFALGRGGTYEKCAKDDDL